jgi:hypothetical protein
MLGQAQKQAAGQQFVQIVLHAALTYADNGSEHFVAGFSLTGLVAERR